MRTLTLCLGNSSLFGGVFAGRSVTPFRLERAKWAGLKPILREAGPINRAVLCSVVPALTKSVTALIRRETGLAAAELTAESPHGLVIGYRQPGRLGTDRLAAALGARAKFAGENVIVVDCGTATTVTALQHGRTLAGGAILPGFSLWPEMLARRTAQLPKIAPGRPAAALGRSPEEAIASGIFFGHVGAIREVTAAVAREAFGREQFIVAGTGGHALELRREKLFTVFEPELILHGLLSFASTLPDHA